MAQFVTLAEVSNTCVPTALMQRLGIDSDTDSVFVSALESANVHIKSIAGIDPPATTHPHIKTLKLCASLITAYYLITPERLPTIDEVQLTKLNTQFNHAIELLRSIPRDSVSSQQPGIVEILGLYNY